MSKSVVVTDHGEFYRAVKGDETRYFPVRKKDEARAFDAINDPVVVRGFAVYDSTISTTYAVGLYATLAEAGEYVPVPAPSVPTGVFNTTTPYGRKRKRTAGKPVT